VKTIWDRPTRLGHWCLAICVTLNLFVLESGEVFHQWTGYVALVTVLFRSVWGFFGAEASRWSSQPLAPSQVLGYMKAGFREPGGAEQAAGHNPLAAWTYVFLWLLVVALAVSGFMMGLDAFWGEEWLQELHEAFANAVKVLVLVHFMGIVIDSIRYRRKTWMRMIRGS